MHAFDTPGKTRLRVKNASGLISVDPSETGRTTVELEALRDDDTTRQAIERATVEMNGNEVTVEIGVGGKGFGVGPAWISFGRTPQVGIRIRCPEDTDLECATASADVAASRPARQRGVEDGRRRHRRRACHRAPRAVGKRGRPCRDGRRRSTPSDRLRRRPPRHGHRSGLGDARLGRLRDRRCPDGPVRQDRLRRSAHRRDSGGADQRPVGLGRRPHRRPPAARASGSTPTRRAATSAPSSTSRTRRRRDRVEPRRGWRRRPSAATSRSPGPRPSQREMRRPARVSVAAPRLPVALGRADDQPVRVAGHACWRCRSSRSSRSRRARFRVAAAHDRRVPAVPSLRSTRRGLGRPAAASPDPDPRRPRARARARHGPGRATGSAS